MTFWYVFRNGLNFFELFKFYFHLGLITTPHVLYVHKTYVLFFTQSHGQEKSLSYYDLFDFGVLFYGCIPILISFFLLYHPTPILTIEIFVMRAYLEKSMGQPRRMEKRKILTVRWRTMFSPH